MKLRPTRIGVKKLTDEKCPRRIILEILMKMKGVQQIIDENQYIIAGNLLHLSLQRIFKNNFEYIEYFYYRKKLSLEGAVQEALFEELKYLTDIYVKINGNWQSSEVISGIQRANDFLSVIAEFSAKYLISEQDGEIRNLMIQDEFSLVLIIDDLLLLKGKIDILAFTKEGNLRIVELKTGTRNAKRDDNQLRIYGEILNYSNNLYNRSTKLKQSLENSIFELWYIKTTEKKIKEIAINSEYSQLQRIKEAFYGIKEINSVRDLPNKAKNCDFFCNLCDFIEKLVPKLGTLNSFVD